MDEATKLPIGPEEVAEAAQILQRYKAGKAALDKRLVDNELWFRMGHWKNYQNPMMEGKPQPSSGWLFNSIANKHADAMDNYPSPNVLPRAEDDEAAAQALSSVLPVVLEQADYEQVYSDTWWRKLKQGTGVKGVFWDPEQRGGVGEIAIRPINLLMLYWEPGVDDIQESPHFFSLSLADTAQLESRWPQLAGHTASVLDVPHYIHDSGLDTSDKSVVVDWYYKKLSPEGRSVLHYCKFCNGVVLYASENDPALRLLRPRQVSLCVRRAVHGGGQPGGLRVHRCDEGVPDRHRQDEPRHGRERPALVPPAVCAERHGGRQ